MQQNAGTEKVVYTVSELNGIARLVLSTHFGTVWVEGEVSNLATPSSGHIYFTLKDRDAQVRCAMFRGNARNAGIRLENGATVLVRAQVGLYEPRGDYQLVVDYVEDIGDGDGALRRAFERLKQKLAAEGLFDQEKKQPLPALPRGIGLITSPTGAAVHDVLTVLKRRFAALPVIVFPTRVQGAGAELEIAAALTRADNSQLCDVLILTRGGGSLEDLWAFNEEVLARAIFACRTPVVSAVGHEVDITIADLVADLRAPTPSAAAEAVSPDKAEWLVRLASQEARLGRHIQQSLANRQQHLGFLHKRLLQAHPARQIERNAQRLDELELRLRRACSALARSREIRLDTLNARLHAYPLTQRLLLLDTRLGNLFANLVSSMQRQLQVGRQAVAATGETLHAVSPLATLERGYAITTRQADGKILRSAADAPPGELLETRLAQGSLLSRVVEKP